MTKKTKTETPDTYADVFLSILDRLEPGEQLRFRNCLGRTLSQCPEIQIRFFNLVLPSFNLTEWEEDMFFLIATMYFNIPHSPDMWNLGHTFHTWIKATDEQRAKYLTTEFENLLSATSSEILYRLISVAYGLKSFRERTGIDIRINYERLINDLIDWDRSYYASAYHWKDALNTPQRNWVLAFVGKWSPYWRKKPGEHPTNNKNLKEKQS